MQTPVKILVTRSTYYVKPLFSELHGIQNFCANQFHAARFLGTSFLQQQNCIVNIRNYTTKTQIQQTQNSPAVGQKDGENVQLTDQSDLKHFKKRLQQGDAAASSAQMESAEEGEQPMGTYVLPHPIWSEKEVYNIEITHRKPKGIVDNMAYYSVQLLRKTFDIFSGFNRGERTEKKWLRRIIFLETVAGVPGMVAAMTRHLHSLRRLRRDHGWIHTLLEEAENERMHLMTAMQLSEPGRLFRFGVITAQGSFVTLFSLAYLFSPRYCHRFVGYLEEEAVITYSKCVQDIKNGPMKHWQTQPAPEVAIRYWCLADTSTMLDVILAIRADESHHRDVNHTLASLDPDKFNPYGPGK